MTILDYMSSHPVSYFVLGMVLVVIVILIFKSIKRKRKDPLEEIVSRGRRQKSYLEYGINQDFNDEPIRKNIKEEIRKINNINPFEELDKEVE